MESAHQLELEESAVVFYSPMDEANLFNWLNGIKCVQKVEGQGKLLLLDLISDSIDDESLRELLAVCYRYKIPMRPLSKFAKSDNEVWFQNPNSYWFNEVFGAS